ncbi:MAG: glycosyltransferase [Pseudomonadota bacterium]
MPGVPRVSVIIVSRHRATALVRCLTALQQQDHPQIEVIVVADPDGMAAIDGFAVKRAVFDQANISAARNIGLRLAAAPVVAFIDDDAVAEPTWAARLAAPFDDPQVVASTGFVRGRNGISFQWQASEVDASGFDHPLAVQGVTLRAGTPARAIKTQGTNCAFRRETLMRIGGFDPAYRFYLDEADVNLRLAGLGLTAIVPDAQVHHGFAKGPLRRADRVPRSLHDIGASTAVFLRRHGGAASVRASLVARERARALRHMVAGRIEPRDVTRLMQSLQDGWVDGSARNLPVLTPLPQDAPDFLPFPGTGPRPGRVMAGRIWQAAACRAAAAQAVARGEVVTLLLLSPDVRPHWQNFTSDGVWEQTGGLFGRSDRSGPRVVRGWLSQRIAAETRRISMVRPIG